MATASAAAACFLVPMCLPNLGGLAMQALMCSFAPVLCTLSALQIAQHWQQPDEAPPVQPAAFVPGSIQSLLQSDGPLGSPSVKHHRGVSLSFLMQFVREFDVNESEATWQV